MRVTMIGFGACATTTSRSVRALHVSSNATTPTASASWLRVDLMTSSGGNCGTWSSGYLVIWSSGHLNDQIKCRNNHEDQMITFTW
jgi:hypothetical protein